MSFRPLPELEFLCTSSEDEESPITMSTATAQLAEIRNFYDNLVKFNPKAEQCLKNTVGPAPIKRPIQIRRLHNRLLVKHYGILSNVSTQIFMNDLEHSSMRSLEKICNQGVITFQQLVAKYFGYAESPTTFQSLLRRQQHQSEFLTRHGQECYVCKDIKPDRDFVIPVPCGHIICSTCHEKCNKKFVIDVEHNDLVNYSFYKCNACDRVCNAVNPTIPFFRL